MGAKIERVVKDIDKTKEKIGELQARLRDLERQKTEIENTEIVDIVRGMDISLADLAALLKGGGVTSGQLGPKPQAAPAAIHTDKEDIENEEE